MRDSHEYEDELAGHKFAELSQKFIPAPDWNLGDQVRRVISGRSSQESCLDFDVGYRHCKFMVNFTDGSLLRLSLAKTS